MAARRLNKFKRPEPVVEQPRVTKLAGVFGLDAEGRNRCFVLCSFGKRFVVHEQQGMTTIGIRGPFDDREQAEYDLLAASVSAGILTSLEI